MGTILVHMTKYAALIRGIGPGDPRKTNEKLRGVFKALGFSNVESVISSGNILFEAHETDVHKLEATIEAAWPEMLDFHATTIVRSYQQLHQILSQGFFNGMTHSEGSYLLITFLKKSAKPTFDTPYQPPGKPYTLLGYADGALFTVTDNTTVKTTDLMTWLERQYGKDITSRTPLTIARIIKRMETTT
jgi:uncharacterized protein (DUF1697 family)